MKKQTKQNRFLKLTKLLLVIVLCVTTFYQSSYTALSCDWPSVYGNSSMDNCIPYYCSPGIHFSFSWEKYIDTPDDEGILTPSAIYDNKLYYAEEDRLCIADIDTGKILRIIDDRKYLSRAGALSIIGNKLIVEARLDENKEQTCALNVDTLETEWIYEHPKCDLYIPAKGNDEYILLTFYNNTLVCLDSATGEKVWMLENIEFVSLQNNKVVIKFDDSSLRCYSIDNFELQWTIDPTIPEGGFKSMAISSDKVFARTSEMDFENWIGSSYFYTIDLNTGEILWHTEEYETIRGIGFSVNHTSVFIHFSEFIHCFNKNTGKKLWEYSPPNYNNPIYHIVSSENTLYYTTIDGIYTIDATDGSLLSYLKTETNLGGWTVNYANRRMVFITTYGKIICFDGTAKARYKIDTDSFKVNDNEYKADISPQIKNSRTLLSVRYVIDPLGGDITWDPIKQKVTCSLLVPRSQTDDLTQKNTVELWIGKPTAKINGTSVRIDPNNPDVVPVIIDGRTMVPMRFLVESLGCSVEWIAESKEIVLTYTP
jgi:outer membrane protein assembly factor BamB